MLIFVFGVPRVKCEHSHVVFGSEPKTSTSTSTSSRKRRRRANTKTKGDIIAVDSSDDSSLEDMARPKKVAKIGELEDATSRQAELLSQIPPKQLNFGSGMI